MPEVNSVVAICNNRSQAEKTMKELRKAGFDMKSVSAVGDARTGRVFLICDLPLARPTRKLKSRRARGKGTRMPKAA